MEIKEIYLNKHRIEKKFQSNNTLAHTTYTPQRFLQADINSSTNTLDFNQYTINSGEPYVI